MKPISAAMIIIQRYIRCSSGLRNSIVMIQYRDIQCRDTLRRTIHVRTRASREFMYETQLFIDCNLIERSLITECRSEYNELGSLRSLIR
jgi:hypothetical protein